MARVCERVSSYLESEIDRGTFPGAQYAIADGGEIVAEGALGNAVVQPERIPVTLSTIFDLASLTKPLVTSLISWILAERGELDLNAPASLYVKELGDREDKRSITVTQLLTHTSGFQRWLRSIANCLIPVNCRVPFRLPSCFRLLMGCGRPFT